MTSKEQEFAELRRWKPHRRNFSYRYFEELVHNEVTTPDNHYLWICRGLRNIIAIALDRVPCYRSLFRELRLAADEVDGYLN